MKRIVVVFGFLLFAIVAIAVGMLSQQRVGAIIAVERQVGMRNYIDGGISLDAVLTYDLLLAIFQPKQWPDKWTLRNQHRSCRLLRKCSRSSSPATQLVKRRAFPRIPKATCSCTRVRAPVEFRVAGQRRSCSSSTTN